MKLQTKILLPIVVLIVVLLGISTFLSYRQASSSLLQAFDDNMDGEAEALLRALKELQTKAEADLEREAARTQIINFYQDGMHDPAAVEGLSSLLRSLSDSYPDFDDFMLLDSKGEVMASSDKAAMHSMRGSEDYFRKAVSGTTNQTSAVRNPATGRAIMFLATPVKVDGKIAGVLLGTLSLDKFFEKNIAPLQIGQSGYGYVLESSGMVVAHKNKDVLFKPDMPGIEDYRDMATRNTGFKDFTNFAGQAVRASFDSDPVTDLTVVIQTDYDDILSGVMALRNSALMVMLGGIIVGCLVVFLIVRPIVRALTQGVAYADKIAAGDLSGVLNVQRKDEIGMLANALRTIPDVLTKIIAEYRGIEEKIESGNLNAEGDAGQFKGEFANLIKGTNGVLGRFRAVINNIPSPVVVLDKNQQASFLSTAAIQVVGGMDCTGKTCKQIFDRDDYGTPQDALKRAVEGRQAASAETRAHPNGKDMDIAYTSIPMYDAKGALASILMLITDLTEIKRKQNTIIEVAGQAHDISNRVAAASEELSAQVEQVSRGSDIQRDRVGSTATAMEQMNSTVLEVARNASQASEQAEATRQRATDGEHLVTQVIQAINKVNVVAEDLNTNMGELSKQAEAIGGVMNVISDIADQTNLLALNAAIEAARAGEAGRGFAVVADEVRKLAEKTMGATSEVGSSIQGIQTSTADNLRRVAEAAQNTRDANQLATNSGAALKEIVALASNNSALIAGIATAAEEQSATSEEINASVEEINRIVAETAEGMVQSSSAVQDLARLAQELRALLERLR